MQERFSIHVIGTFAEKDMYEKSLHTLEYDKIIAMLTEHAYTEAGKSCCKHLLPSEDVDEIRALQEETKDATERIISFGSISFSGVKNILGSVKRLDASGFLSAPELLNISKTLSVASRVNSYGKQRESNDSLSKFFNNIEVLAPLRNEIDRCIISEEEIADDASATLKNIRRKERSIDDRVHKALSSLLISAKDYLQDAIITMRDGRYTLPVRAEYKNQIPGLVHDQSGSGSTYFIEPISVVNLGNELKQLQIEEQKEIEKILAGLSEQASEYTHELSRTYEALVSLDFIFARGSFAVTYNGIMPAYNTERRIKIKQGRHPLLDPKKVVPITVSLGDEFDLLIVTGPNTGGKTVTLKTIGLLSLMGQAGLHIPAASGSELAVFKNIYADIGDEQSIEQSLSTFSAHMTNIVHIMNNAGLNSLVLFDELGAGTDPVEGAALAMAILSNLHRSGIRTVATTHYSELKLFALATSGVENASCEFDVATLRPTYKLLVGIPGKSNAFAISKRLGLPDYIIEEAKSSIGENDEAFEDVLSDLESRRKNLEANESEAIKLRSEIEKLKSELASKKESLESQKNRILNEAKEEAKSIIMDAKESADKAIRAMNKAGVPVGKEAEQQRSELRKKADLLSAKEIIEGASSSKVKASDLHIGDGVMVLSMNHEGTVSSLPDSKGNLFVQMGILRSQVNIKDIKLLPEQKQTKGKNKMSGVAILKRDKTSNISSEINLIGMRVDEAMPALDKYLDDAYLSHLEKVRIIHGRGTGALKDAVVTMLRKNKNIASYRAGEYTEGGYGVTVAEFK